MTYMGLRAWVTKLFKHVGSDPFFFKDLPEDLQSRADLLKAASSGYIERIERQRVSYQNGNTGERIVKWQITCKGTKWSKRCIEKEVRS